MSKNFLMPPFISNIFFRWQLKSVRRRYLMLYPQLFWPYLISVSPFAILGIGTVIIASHDFYWGNWNGGAMVLGWALLLGLPFWVVLIFWCRWGGFDFKKTCFFVGSFKRKRLQFEQISAIKVVKLSSASGKIYYSFNLVLTDQTEWMLFSAMDFRTLNEYAGIIASAMEKPVLPAQIDG